MKDIFIRYKKRENYGVFSIEAILVISILLIFAFYIIKNLNMRIMATKEQTISSIEGNEFGKKVNGMQITPPLAETE